MVRLFLPSFHYFQSLVWFRLWRMYRNRQIVGSGEAPPVQLYKRGALTRPLSQGSSFICVLLDEGLVPNLDITYIPSLKADSIPLPRRTLMVGYTGSDRLVTALLDFRSISPSTKTQIEMRTSWGIFHEKKTHLGLVKITFATILILLPHGS